jgi:hypothetical protein
MTQPRFIENSLNGTYQPPLGVPWKGAPDPRERYPAGKLSLQPEALGADQEATNGLKHSEKRP